MAHYNFISALLNWFAGGFWFKTDFYAETPCKIGCIVHMHVFVSCLPCLFIVKQCLCIVSVTCF